MPLAEALPAGGPDGAATGGAAPAAAAAAAGAPAGELADGRRTTRCGAHAAADDAATLDRRFESLRAAEAGGSLPAGTADALRAELQTAKDAAERAEAQAAAAAEKVQLHEKAAAAAEAVKKNHKELAVKVKSLVKELNAVKERTRVLSLARFKTDSKLQAELSSFVYFDTVTALVAHIDAVDAAFPLDHLKWIDTNARAAAAGDGAGGERERQRKRRRFPVSGRDAIVFFLFVIRTGSTLKRARALFGLGSKQTARRTFVTMLELHKLYFSEEMFRLESDALFSVVPEMMKTYASYEGYDTTCVHIIDGFERIFEKPSDDVAQAACWSSYKHNYTLKFLLDILSNGAFYFISDAYPGSVTDPVLSRVCGFLYLLTAGADTMADKGFLLQEELEERDCLLHIPPVRRMNQKQGTVEEAERTHHVANRRIFVENAVKRMKEWGWFGCGILSISQKHLHGDVAFVIAMLCNYGRPLVPVAAPPQS